MLHAGIHQASIGLRSKEYSEIKNRLNKRSIPAKILDKSIERCLPLVQIMLEMVGAIP